MKLPHVTIPKPPRAVVVTVIVILGVCVVVTSASAVIRVTHNDRILPGVHVGGIALGGLNHSAALQTLQTAYDAMLDDELAVSVDGSLASIPLRASGQNDPDLSHNAIDMDIAGAVSAAYDTGRQGGALARLFRPLLLATLFPTNIETATVFSQHLETAVTAAFPDVENPGTPIGFTINMDGDEPTVTVTPSVDGKAFDWETATAALVKDAQDFRLGTLTVPVVTIKSDITIDDATTLVDSIDDALAAAPYTLSHTPENRTDAKTWEVTQRNVADWLTPGRNEDGALMLTLDATAMAEFLATLHEDIDVAAQNARFSMQNDRVVEFAASRDGVTVNDADTIRAIADFLGTDDTEILVMVDRVTPTVPTESANSLGINEVIGVGMSDFKGSPRNRIANIKHGASKLNGILIAPGETLSLLEQLRPFTVEDGYLPELVIKGDEIKPEVGGGLCQIGTTTFRAVMNSGLKIVERRNHSLVVSYYNDPSNNNPGTDATIYDPSPDFKFQNDMATYILLTTEVDEEEKKLYFTFWGTSDGRNGSYEPPTVLSWSGYGETKYTETETLAPGVEQCQSPHPGATTTFTYNVTYADGTAYEEEYFSSYRSLPKICLVGKSADTPETSAEPETPTEPTDVEVPTPVEE